MKTFLSAWLLLSACATAPARPIEPVVTVPVTAPVITPAVTRLPVDLPAPPGPTSRRVDFKSGNPIVPVRLMENAQSISFSSRGRLKLKLSGKIEKTIDAAPGASWSVRIRESTPGVVVAAIQIAEFQFVDKAGLEKRSKQRV